MKIKTLDIYGYGKWINQRFELNEHLQLIYGPNEAGKSTLQSFIRSILFGFPTKRKRINQQNRYEPKKGNRYGGRLLLTETPFGDLWIERTAAGVMIQNLQGDLLPSNVLEEILSGMDERLFDTFYAFNIQNLQELSRLDANQINDYFLSIGTVGSDQFLNVAKQLEKETDELYRPQAHNRPINQLLSEYEQLAEKVEESKASMKRYDFLLEAREKENQTIQALNATIKDLDSQLRERDKLITRYDTYLKDRAANRELEQLVYIEIDPSYPDQLKEANKAIQANQLEIAQLNEKITLIKGELGSMTRLNWAINHEKDREIWLQRTQQIKEIQANIEQAQARIVEQQKIMQDLASRGQFYPDKVENTSEYTIQLESGLLLQERKINLLKNEENLKAERKVYLEQRKTQQNYSAVVRSQVAKLETQRMNEEALLIEETSLKNYFVTFIFLVIGIVIMSTQMMDNNNSTGLLFWLGIIMLIIGLVSTLYIFYGHRKKYQAFHNSPIVPKIAELRQKEIDYQEQSKAIGIEINHREEGLAEIEKEKQNNAQELQKWLVSIGFYPTADPEWVLKTNPVKAYFEAEALKEHFEAEINKNHKHIEEWRELTAPLFERFPFAEEGVRLRIRYIEELEAQLKVTQLRGQSLNERIEETIQKIEQLTEKIAQDNAKIKTILTQTNSRNEIDFDLKVKDNQRINELKQLRLLYQEQIQGHEEALAEISNKQALVEEYKRLEAKMLLTQEQLVPHHEERANLEVEIRYLEQDGTYQTLIQQLENKRAELKEKVLYWSSKRVAMEMIYQTLRHGLNDPLPQMTQRANELFEKLSYGRYTQIKLNKTDVKVIQFSGILFEPHELSQGTLEQLYVALRLAFVESATSMVKLPLMIDDAFVNFDDIRKTSMYQVLESFSQTTQILYFTFDQAAKQAFSNHHTIDLEAMQPIEEEESNEHDITL